MKATCKEIKLHVSIFTYLFFSSNNWSLNINYFFYIYLTGYQIYVRIPPIYIDLMFWFEQTCKVEGPCMISILGPRCTVKLVWFLSRILLASWMVGRNSKANRAEKIHRVFIINNDSIRILYNRSEMMHYFVVNHSNQILHIILHLILWIVNGPAGDDTFYLTLLEKTIQFYFLINIKKIRSPVPFIYIIYYPLWMAVQQVILVNFSLSLCSSHARK